MKLLLYCTKAKPYLYYAQESRTLMEIDNSFEGYKTTNKNVDDTLNGKIVAECDFEVEKILPIDISEDDYNYGLYSGKNILKYSCLDNDDICEYLKDYDGETILKSGYAIHIKNLHIFAEPKELSDYYSYYNEKTILNAPQNMMMATSGFTDYKGLELPNDIKILISIRPQWLCKILNGEKTIEVRKKVLKELLE